jgi:hypothetical protein
VNAREELYRFAMRGKQHSPDTSERMSQTIDAFRAEVLRTAADDLVAACPEHSDADEVWMDCPCEIADELRAKAALAETGGAQ